MIDIHGISQPATLLKNDLIIDFVQESFVTL